ncbi:anther-specific proline-rich protein APG-like [Miscanthus floridulus]|uniref:anther-specific proline-rich protein APG-like n=1 Tax=Miscanthus floridulus TaxID=154761 RepID=UPI0034588ED3
MSPASLLAPLTLLSQRPSPPLPDPAPLPLSRRRRPLPPSPSPPPPDPALPLPDPAPPFFHDSPAVSDPTPQPQAPPPQQPLLQAASPTSTVPKPPSRAHMRSLSLDAAFFDGLSLHGGGGVARHKRSSSMDGATSSFEGECVPSSVLPGYAKKAVPDDKLAELMLLDPKHAKR